MDTITDIIKSLRDSHSLSQTEISRLTGIPQSRLSRWEGGDSPRGADDALKLRDLSDRLSKKKVNTSRKASIKSEAHQ